MGFLLTLVAFITYFSVFIWFPVTRDFPWASLPIFLLAVVLLVMGVRRGFAADRPHPTRSKIFTSIVAMLSVVVIAFFVFTVFVAARWLPASKGAPQVGQQAPDFTLTDATGKQVSLTELRTAPIDGKAPKGVLLIFYRGYW
jgi:flagellar biosynthesis component FlhA